MSSARPKNYSKSANRALEVLDYFARVGRPARSADIADALGIARSSADQLLKSMMLAGYLVMSAERTSYFPSLRLARFGQWMGSCYPDSDLLVRIVDEVHAGTGEIVTLTMENDCFMQMMASARGADADPALDVGSRVPVVGSAIGGAALTTKSREDVARLVERARRQHALIDGGEQDRAFLDEIRLFRMKGYSWRRNRRRNPAAGEGQPVDYWSIAMPLPGAASAPNIVLGLAGPAQRVRAREWEIVNLMRRSIRLHLQP